MILKKDTNSILMTEPISEVQSASVIIPQWNHFRPLPFVAMSSIQSMRKHHPDVKGTPIMYGFDHDTNCLEFYPTTPEDLEIRVRIVPPIKEI